MPDRPIYSFSKRFCDVVASLMLLLLLLPVFILIAVAIMVESGRPVLFKQVRAGRAGCPFDILKFRTLHTGMHDPTQPLHQATPVGRFLRRWALDELPQLWNILLGEMSFVGPRPTLPDQVACYGSFESQRLAVRPGLTGWAQIHGRNALSWPERIELDVWYVHHRNSWLDLLILLRTPLVLLRGEGLYGKNNQNVDFQKKTTSEAPGTIATETQSL